MKQPEKILVRLLKYLNKNYCITIQHLKEEKNLFTCRKRLKQDVIHRLIALKMLFRYIDKFKEQYPGKFKDVETLIIPSVNDMFNLVANLHIRFNPDELRAIFNIPLVEWNQYVAEIGKTKFTLEGVMIELADEQVARYAVKAIIQTIFNNSTAHRQTRNYLWDKFGIPQSTTQETKSSAIIKTAKRRSHSKIERLGCEKLVNEMLDQKSSYQETADKLAEKGYIVSIASICRYDTKRRME